jgi:hypothetical protein
MYYNSNVNIFENFNLASDQQIGVQPRLQLDLFVISRKDDPW